jgi:DNA-binding MarR family transcriptional regulator
MPRLRCQDPLKHDIQVVILEFDTNGVNWKAGAARANGAEAMASARDRTKATPRSGARPIVDSKAEAIAELMLEVAQCFFRIRALGQKTGLITSWGGGAFGFMRSLALLGPLTVPQIAQMRPTSRQRMQRLADELAAEGLVEFIDNPKHRRSKLVQLTPKGDARYDELNARFLTIASTMGVALGEADIRKTAEIVRRLSDDVKGRSERLS